MWEVIAIASLAVVGMSAVAIVAVVVIARVTRDIAQRAMDHMTVAGDPMATARLTDLEESREARAIRHLNKVLGDKQEVERFG